MKILIIEDEILAAEELARMLTEINSKNIIVKAVASVAESVKWLSNNDAPDVIFMDIHLEDGICFSIFDQIEVKSPVIFTTAYDQYALEAFNANGVAYLLKPIDNDELCDTLKKLNNYVNLNIEKLQKTGEEIIQNKQTAKQKCSTSRIAIRKGDNYTYISVEDVAYFYSDEHYTFVVTHSNERNLINSPLNELEEVLDNDKFFRVSRNCIVNICSIEKISKHITGRLKLKLNPDFGTDLFVARNRMKDFVNWLGIR
ncbi:MAG: LytTR family DNA-binding domain-containing protein [Paludibacteraceae bacterium]|nr:LytTR family DNA-binding domain-containing protein [Paludibacteraceae bacterium]